MLDRKFTDHSISSSLYESQTDLETQDKIAKPAQIASKTKKKSQTNKHTRTQTIAQVSKYR